MAAEQTLNDPITKARVVRWVFYGVIVSVFSLNGVLRLIAHNRPDSRLSSLLTTIASVPDALYLGLPGGKFLLFELVLRWVLIVLTAYVLLLLIASLRHQSAAVAVSGISGLLVGLFALTWLSILILLVGLLITLLAWIADLVRYVIEAIASFLLWGPVFYTILSVVALALVAGLIKLVKSVSFAELWNSLKEWLRNLSARPIVFFLMMLAVVALIWFVGIPLWKYYIEPLLLIIKEWLIQYIVPIISFIGSILVTLFLALVLVSAVVVSLGMLGWQFAEQFLSARFCGRTTSKSFEAGFSIGAVMGLVLLVCSANPTFRSLVNASWSDTSPILSSLDLGATVYMLMPARAELLLHEAFAKASLPIFDLICLLIALLLATASLITSLLSSFKVEPLRDLFSWTNLPPIGKLLFGFVLMLGVTLIGSGDDA
ncbi:MAG TPA: hypothetical protein VLB46_05650 [Pyrinomonadaceae bacterium]|nr:hypothetical protein [Pyrinomonadaceae bacterium]